MPKKEKMKKNRINFNREYHGGFCRKFHKNISTLLIFIFLNLEEREGDG